jgi:signal transduction histidine kinase
MDAMADCSPDRRKIEIQSAFDDALIEVSVLDWGTGIPDDKIGDIFETFYSTKQHGTGLGLSITRTIVASCGGRIRAENRPGGGAVFRFTLPRVKLPAMDRPEEASAATKFQR